jgi:hypothetical protein
MILIIFMSRMIVRMTVIRTWVEENRRLLAEAEAEAEAEEAEEAEEVIRRPRQEVRRRHSLGRPLRDRV